MTNETVGKDPEEDKDPEDKIRDIQKSRRESRQELWVIISGISGAFIPLASLLGASTTAKVWSGFLLVFAACIVFLTI